MTTKFKDYVTSKGQKLAELSNEDIYVALLHYVKELAAEKPKNTAKRKVYYISAEFLIGKLLSNNLINLGIYKDVKAELAAAGKSIAEVEDVELEPSLGNGGLGRLASCFIDSMSTLGINGEGVGLNYHCGLFKQVFVDNQQEAEANYWIEKDSWLVPTDISYDVPFKDFTLKSRLDRIDVLGYKRDTKNYLNLFDIDGLDYGLIHDGISFDKTEIKKNLTLFLYPDDSDRNGELLRIYQQYFMVSNAAQLLIDEALERGSNLHDLADYAYVQINDTHPSMVIPELIRLLTEKHGIDFDEAVSIVKSMVGYTNHTILAEALEKWPRHYLDTVVPQLMPIIEKLDAIAKTRTDNAALAIIDQNQVVHMAHMDIHFSHSTNGVATRHTQILKESELAAFYQMYPEKFNNKTNGITFRRWLLKCNPTLTSEIENLIGDGFKKDASELKKLLAYTDDTEVLSKIRTIKKDNKQQLAAWLADKQGIQLNTDAMFSIQSKRLHEYKRQQLNLLFLIHEYLEIKAGHVPATPLVSIFGAKAAPAYIIAKDIIHGLLTLSQVISEDPQVSRWLQLAFVENYNVSAAEKMIPACDLSEQISLASKEASGTGNMKFMLNGALTLGTMDGANVEIAEAVGNDNIYIFGQSSKQVIHHYAAADYCARDWYEADPNLHRAIDFLTSEEMLKYGDEEHLKRLQHELISKDWFQTLPDFNAYVVRKEQAMKDYAVNPEDWSRRTLINIAEAGFFSSDRTIAEYDQDIWHLGK